jgi:putative holliday junction resolvase
MRFLGLDIGDRRTGVSFFDDNLGIVMPVTTIDAKDRKTLVEGIVAIADQRKVDRFVIGIPRLPSGDEGEQARHVRAVGNELAKKLPIAYVDERYTSVPLREKGGKHVEASDVDTWAASQILEMYVARKDL